MRAVDTNVLVRLITRDDPGQTATAESFIANGAWVSTLAVAQAIWVLGSVYDVQAAEQAEVVKMLLNHRQLVLQEPETVSAALDLFRTRPALGFSDCLMLEAARRSGHLPLGTFDRNLAKVDGAERL